MLSTYLGRVPLDLGVRDFVHQGVKIPPYLTVLFFLPPVVDPSKFYLLVSHYTDTHTYVFTLALVLSILINTIHILQCCGHPTY